MINLFYISRIKYLIMKSSYKLILISIAFLVSSCSTILYGKREKVSFNSYPQGAEIFINDKSTGQFTPAIINVNKNDLFREPGFKVYKFEMRKEGYFPYVEKHKVKYHFVSSSIGNAGFALSSGFVVALATPFIVAPIQGTNINNPSLALTALVATVFTIPIAFISGPIVDVNTGSVKKITKDVQADLIPIK